ncbi:rifin PIR protein, putative [Plasmodium reichenowi]|uniref:Rifin PIR protein, putative n=1 Tax=Plasmodium reichenowi TaxID=5854 RepID=A0A2P9D5U4_PLARE|nr:rifin PIR protein, putative [Plasmodium reichenowi]
MNVHYINILLFALPLNILANHKNNKPSIRTPHTQKIPTTRLLCECELYAPANYDNDPHMKEVMENFNKQTQQRFHEYDDRMIEKRKQCKDKCDKEIQKIILKDKLEKHMAEQLTTLETKITNDDIPTCICEKSLADKTEKFCLNCGKNMGAIAPWWGLVCGAGYGGWSHYAATTLVEIAKDAAIKAGLKVGLANVAKVVTKLPGVSGVEIPKITVADLMAVETFTDGVTLPGIFNTISSHEGTLLGEGTDTLFSFHVQNIVAKPKLYAAHYSAEAAEVTKVFADTKTGILAEGTSTTSSLTTAITVSVIAIVIIIFVMVIIYLILRYRRKKKMKKKLQYIKLLEE